MNYSLDTLKKQNSASIKKVQNGEKSSLATLKKGISTSSTDIEKRVNNYATTIIDDTAKRMRENITEIIFIIDKSTTCKGLENATCAGYNELITNERRTGYPTKVTTVLFSNGMDIYSFREDINRVMPLDYKAFGGTALYDTIVELINQTKTARLNDPRPPKRTVVAIMTDGIDEHSVDHDLEEVRKLIQECQNNGWEFIFFGALANADQIAADLGIKSNNSVQTENTREDAYNTFASISNALDDLRKHGRLSDNWANKLRKKKTNNISARDNSKRLELK